MVLVSCSTKTNKDLPTLYISVRTIEKGSDYCELKWIVRNKSNIPATFVDGNIEQYQIRNTNTNKKYTSEKNDIDTVLNNGDEYSNNILLHKLEKGNYECTFWAKSEEGTKGTMKMSFKIE